MNVSGALGAAAILAAAQCGAPAWAQSAPRSHFGRTSSGMDATASRGLERTAAARPADDPLAPYSSRPRGASSGTPIATPQGRPASPPVARNYYPTARSGQVRRHCTPSRASSLGSRR